MPPRSRFLAVAVSLLPALAGCAVVSDAPSTAALRDGPARQVSFTVPQPPAQACPRLARMLSWCADGVSYHYRCLIAADNDRAELSGSFEAVYRTEVFLVVDLVREGGGSRATLYQAESWMGRDYAAILERYLTRPDSCQPG